MSSLKYDILQKMRRESRMLEEIVEDMAEDEFVLFMLNNAQYIEHLNTTVPTSSTLH